MILEGYDKSFADYLSENASWSDDNHELDEVRHEVSQREKAWDSLRKIEKRRLK